MTPAQIEALMPSTLTLNGNVYSKAATAFLVETYRQSDTYGSDFYPAVVGSEFNIPEKDIWAAWDYFNN